MLNQTAITYLAALTYREDAKRQVCWIPVGGIYWDDEIPDLQEIWKVPEDGLLQVLRLFSIRYGIWRGESLSGDDQLFWDDARSQLPGCPIFQRLKLSPDDLLAQESAARAGAETFEALSSEADQVSVIEKCPGVEEFSITFDIAKGQGPVSQPKPPRKSWWARLFG